jgi:hypothetical protein
MPKVFDGFLFNNFCEDFCMAVSINFHLVAMKLYVMGQEIASWHRNAIRNDTIRYETMDYVITIRSPVSACSKTK